MATDSTHLLPGDTGIETDTDMSAGSSDLGSLQLAAATGDAIPVNIPGGQQVVVIPVQPGQTIALPTDAVDGLLAKLGADGNLAIVVDGRTIILKGYAEANGQSPITIVTNDGDVVDIAEVIVATNPDIAIDIQTAAGPAAAGAQAGTDGAGSGIFVPFAAGVLLGGFDAEGTLKATQLAYKNIDDDRVLFTREEAGNNLPQDIKIVPDEGQPTGEGGSFLLDEDFLPPNSPGGNQDLPQPSPGDDAGSDTASGTVVVDFGLDGPRAFDPIVMSDIAPGTGSSLFALNGGADPTVPGGEILLDLDAPNAGTQVLHGVLNGVEYFRITLDTSTGHFVVEQFEPLFHDERNIEDNVFLDIEFTAFDSNLDELHATLHLDFDDDMPEIVRTDASISLAVDESLAAGKATGDFDDPNYATLPQDGTREEDDENLVSLPASLTNIAPVIGAAEAGAAGLFDVHIGADDFANTKLSQVYSLTILDADKDTGLTDTQTQDAIYLFDNNGVIEGRADDGDNNPDNDPVVFALTIHPFTGEISMAQYRAVDHGGTEEPSALDEVTYLGLDNLAVTLTVVDGDGDKVANSVDLGNFVSFDDDRPTLTVCVDGRAAAGLLVELDETEGSDRYAPGEAPDGGNTDDAGPGLAQRTTDITGGLKALFLVGGSCGSDGPGTLTDKLSFGGFGGGDLDTNLEATDGGAIVLHLASDTLIEGKDGDGDVVFTIEIIEVNPGEFQLQTTLFEALVHGDNTKFDESVQLLLEEGTVQLQYDVTRTDGDGDEVTASKSINLISEEGSYFTFDDDGPSLTVTAKDASAL
ncbi:MAG: hypothetical protein C0484_14410, partial [Rhodospirillum sp.]|nr:hypothetical protein [Rhodospirillum sp.]